MDNSRDGWVVLFCVGKVMKGFCLERMSCSLKSMWVLVISKREIIRNSINCNIRWEKIDR